MSEDILKKYLSMDLRNLRTFCVNKRLNGITRKSNRQQCLNAVLEMSKQSPNHKKTTNRRRSLPNSTPHNRKSTASRSHTPNTKPSKRSRKRRRREMDQDTQHPIPTMERSTKRRRTSNPSTMTTPERAINMNKSPLRNPRIPQTFEAQAPLPPTDAMNYQAADFLNLLDDSSDEDIDIKDRNQDTHSPKQKPNVLKPSSPLLVMKDSSSEDLNNIIQSESENDESTQSESESESDDALPRQTYHRNAYKYEDDIKSRSRSTLKPRNKGTASMQYKRAIPNIPQKRPLIPISPLGSYNIRDRSPPKIVKMKNTILAIFWFPLAIWEAIMFLWKNKLGIFVVTVIIAALYSPLTKMIESIDYNVVLQTLHIIPKERYCNTDNVYDTECVTCPDNADCIDGYLYCKGERRLIKGECVYDEKEIDKLQNEMQSYSLSLLSRLNGEYQCSSYTLYRSLWGINEVNDNGILPLDQLSHELAKALQLDSTSHLFQKVFDKFTESIKEWKKGELKYKKNSGYYSTASYKSLSCCMVVVLTDNCLVIIPSVLMLIVVSVWWIKRRRQKNKMLRRKQLAQDRKKDVLCIMQNYMNNLNEKWIPIAQIRVQIMGANKSDEEWNKVERLVDRDANIQKSAQMVDGLQKLCWKLSDTALIH